jgi:hypothetical protein
MASVRHVGSAEHKSFPSAAGGPRFDQMRPRAITGSAPLRTLQTGSGPEFRKAGSGGHGRVRQAFLAVSGSKQVESAMKGVS